MSRKGSPNICDETIERIGTLRALNWTHGQIAKALGISRGSVDYQCRKHAFEPAQLKRPRDLYARRAPVARGGQTVRPFEEHEDAMLLRLEAQGLRDSEIARRLGRWQSSVAARLATLARHEERALEMGMQS